MWLSRKMEHQYSGTSGIRQLQLAPSRSQTYSVILREQLQLMASIKRMMVLYLWLTIHIVQAYFGAWLTWLNKLSLTSQGNHVSLGCQRKAHQPHISEGWYSPGCPLAASPITTAAAPAPPLTALLLQLLPCVPCCCHCMLHARGIAVAEDTCWWQQLQLWYGVCDRSQSCHCHCLHWEGAVVARATPYP